MRLLLPILALSAGLSGCLYSNVHAPRAYRSSTPSDLKTAAGDPLASGEGCSTSLLYLVAWGDASYAKAVEEALKSHPEGILYDVRSDAKIHSFLFGLYSEACTVVTGRVGKL